MELQRTLDELTYQLEEAGGATQAQMDLNRKREAEMQRIKRELEEYQVQNEIKLSSYKKKQQEALNEMADQLENMQKSKQKFVLLSIFSFQIFNSLIFVGLRKTSSQWQVILRI